MVGKSWRRYSRIGLLLLLQNLYPGKGFLKICCHAELPKLGLPSVSSSSSLCLFWCFQLFLGYSPGRDPSILLNRQVVGRQVVNKNKILVMNNGIKRRLSGQSSAVFLASASPMLLKNSCFGRKIFFRSGSQQHIHCCTLLSTSEVLPEPPRAPVLACGSFLSAGQVFPASLQLHV